MIQQMNKTKINNFKNYIFILLIVAIIIILYKNNKCESVNLINVKRLNSMDLDIYEDDFEGKTIVFNKTSNQNNIVKNYKIIVVVDTIKCLACFKYHMEEIKKLSNVDRVGYSPRNFELLQAEIDDIIVVKEELTDLEKMLTNNLSVALINKNNKIIYYEIADKNNYSKAERFYKKVKLLLEKI